MADTTIALYGEITKKDPAQRLVSGYISSEQVDLAGQIVDQDWLKSALPRWMQFGNIREQHRADKAVGRAKEVDITTEPGPLLTAKIVDRDAWEKIEEGVYNGFSIGIKNPIIVKDASAPRGLIVGGELIEVSIVDRPCNNESLFTLVKAVGPGEWKDMQTGAVIADTLTADETKRDFSTDQRKKDSKSGAALPDGSFPIESKSDLSNAIHAFGRAKDKAKAKAHIISRAKALGATALLPDGWKAVEADLEKSRPKHSHPYVGTHNHTHVHPGSDGRMYAHIHPHVHEDDDIHEHEHQMHPAASSATTISGLPALKEATLNPDEQKAVEQAVETETTEQIEKAVDTAPEAPVVEVEKAAPDAVQGESSPSRPGRFASELTAIKDALSRLEALADQTDADRDGDVDFGGADSALNPDKTEDGDFQAERPAPDAVLIHPMGESLSFSTMADLAKALLADDTFRTTLRTEIEAVSGDVYTAKAATTESDTQASIADVAKMSGDLAKGLSLIAADAEAKAKDLQSVRADLTKAQDDLAKVKELAQPVKGLGHVIEKGMLGNPDRFAELTKTSSPAEVATELAKMSEQDRIAFAAKGLKGLYGR